MVNFARDFVVKVEVKNKESGEQYNSFDDLFNDLDCESILVELGTKFLSGFNPKK